MRSKKADVGLKCHAGFKGVDASGGRKRVRSTPDKRMTLESVARLAFVFLVVPTAEGCLLGEDFLREAYGDVGASMFVHLGSRLFGGCEFQGLLVLGLLLWASESKTFMDLFRASWCLLHGLLVLPFTAQDTVPGCERPR